MTTWFSIRRVHPADAAALREFYGRLSKDSSRARFLGCVSEMSRDQSLSFCTPDHMHGEGFVAVSERPADRGVVLGHLCLEPAGNRRLELAVAVADAEQGHGIGRELFRTALDWAVERGYQSLIATCLADNSRVLSLLSSAPNPARVGVADAGVVRVDIPLAAPMPADWSSAAMARARRRRQPLDSRVRAPFRAVWRRMSPPAPVAEG